MKNRRFIASDCGGSDHIRPLMESRREFLQVGLIGGLGLTLPQFLQMEASAAQKHYESKEGKAKSVIHIFLPGGMAHQETWDPKPYNPAEYRGPFGSIDTKITGHRFGSHLKEMAKIADKCVVINSMTHGEAAHERGVHNMFTGYRPSPAIKYPSLEASSATSSGPATTFRPTSAFRTSRMRTPAADISAALTVRSALARIPPAAASACATSRFPVALMKVDSIAAATCSRPSTNTSAVSSNPTRSMPWTPSTSGPTRS